MSSTARWLLKLQHQRGAATVQVALLIVAIAVGGISVPSKAQTLPDQSTARQENPSASPSAVSPLIGGDSTETEDREATMANDSNSSVASSQLSADQIVQILQENPSLLLEVKNQIADRFQQQGIQINVADISDEAVYKQIGADDSLRTTLSRTLVSRGYAAPAGIQSLNGASRQSQILASPSISRITGSSRENEETTPASSTNLPTLMPASKESNTSRSGSIGTNRGRQETHASTDMPRVTRQPTPYDLQSMRDLYVQIPTQSAPLKRFGSEIFVDHGDSSMTRMSVSGVNAPLDIPLGPDYIVGPGDSLTINLWGGLTQSIIRVIDREGKVFLPEAGSVQVAGLSLGEAEKQIRAALTKQYRDAQVSVTISRLHSVRLYVVGDVQRPGGYDLSALATPLSALYAAGGPTSVGSLRILKHYRGQQLIEEIDLYDFLLHGVQTNTVHFESGDTLQIPPAGPQVAISGAVKRPAIYELKSGESNLASVIEDAGGLTAAASLGHITVERIDANQKRETLTLKDSDSSNPQVDSASLQSFAVQDGDRIHIAPILPYSDRVIYLEGHVFRPGRLPYRDGMRLSDVLHSYQDLLPEPAAHGELIRLVPPDLHAENIPFNLPDVLIGNDNLTLQPFDTIRVFGRYEEDTPTVTIHGEVLRPGIYPLSRGMTAAQLVRMAGGFKRDALLDTADLTSYRVENGNRVNGEIATVRIGSAVSGSDPSADVGLKAGDILTIHQITGWNDIGQSVAIRGQVRFPGSYGFHEGERLSSVLRRAGGMRDTAYPEGAVLIRNQVRELEEKSRTELIRQIETNSAAARLGAGDTGGRLQLIKAQQDEAVEELKSHPATGRMVIHISADIDSWANTPADIEVRSGDVITIPKRPGFVLVSGQVYNATALTFTPGKTAAWYLSRAGGTNGTANKREIFIIRANGSVVGRHSGGWFDSDVLSTRLNPGDVVVVPQKIIGASLLWRNLLTTAQLASSIAITAGIAVAAL